MLYTLDRFLRVVLITFTLVLFFSIVAPSQKGSQNAETSSLSPQKVLAQSACTGIAASERTSDGNYSATGFGCSAGKVDPNDNCVPQCGNPPGLCDGLSGPECEAKVGWFAADKDRYGCFNKLKVTNPETKKAVVVMVIDQGPACDEENAHGPLIDLSFLALQEIGASGNYDTLNVQPVDASTPLGPTDGSASTGTGTGNFGTIPALSLVVKPKQNDSYVINVATADVIGASTAGGTSTGANPDATGFLKAAQDVMAAYQKCEPPGFTFAQSGLDSCLTDFLSKAGYSQEQVAAFAQRLPGSRVGHGSGECTECLGFIGITAALWGATADGGQTLGVDRAGVVNDMYKTTGFSLAGHKYAPIGTGAGVKIQPGDIAVAGSATCGCDHIGIVSQSLDDTHMNLLESNGGNDCKITDKRDYPVAKDPYTFYRQQ